MGVNLSGSPFVGTLSLTNAAPGPAVFALFTSMGGAAYTLQANERLQITNITVGSNDTTQRLITVDTGGATPTKLVSGYTGGTSNPFPLLESMQIGACRGVFGTPPRATAAAVTSGKTIEIIIKGFITKT